MLGEEVGQPSGAPRPVAPYVQRGEQTEKGSDEGCYVSCEHRISLCFTSSTRIVRARTVLRTVLPRRSLNTVYPGTAEKKWAAHNFPSATKPSHNPLERDFATG